MDSSHGKAPLTKEMEISEQDPIVTNISSAANSSRENHILENMGEISYDLQSPNPVDQAEASFANTFSLEKTNTINGGVIQVEGSCHCFPLDEVLKATNGFDDALVVGKGGYGNVYKGVINNDATSSVVAIKRLAAQSAQGAEEFWTEVNLLSKFHHTHLVPLIGYCNENQEMILVYEFIANGTLASHLYESSKEENSTIRAHLSWALRLNICLGAARGLDYLHTGTEQRIIHRDVKSTNILLDGKWVALVSDFGICKLIASHSSTTHVSTKVKATRGYWDPDYIYTNRVTRKSDVYAFGVVLLEIMCGRPPLDNKLDEERVSLVLWAKEHIENSKLDKIIDPSLNGETTPQSLKCFAKLAYNCLHTKPKERPEMSKVVEILESALALHERKGRSRGTITYAFQSLKLVAVGMNHWGRERNRNSSEDGRGISKQSFSRPNFNDILFPRFSLVPIRTATNDFSEDLLISRHSDYILYRGYELGGSFGVAIKRFYKRKEKYYRAEVQVHSLTCHNNIASLVGFCDEEHELILVYNYMANGTLRSQLEETNYSHRLLWKKRLEICIDIARGLEYLHTNGDQQVIHRNIRSSNILLDDKWTAKVANFDISMTIPTIMPTQGVITYSVVGTFGYLDPEYALTGKVTEKIDVFSFGVVLLEVLCAKTVTSLERDVSLYEWFYGCIEKGTIDDVIDPYLLGKVAPDCFKHYVNIALSCLVEEGIKRPSLYDVLRGLQSSLQMQEAWEGSIEMGDELHMADVSRSYNDVISVESKFTFGGHNYLISDLVGPWSTSLSGNSSFVIGS